MVKNNLRLIHKDLKEFSLDKIILLNPKTPAERISYLGLGSKFVKYTLQEVRDKAFHIIPVRKGIFVWSLSSYKWALSSFQQTCQTAWIEHLLIGMTTSNPLRSIYSGDPS